MAISEVTVLPFEASGAIYVPSSAGVSLRNYVLLKDDRVFLLAPDGSDFEPVPATARAAIGEQYPGRTLTFPGLPGTEAPTAPAPVPDLGQESDLLWVDPTSIELVYGAPDPQGFLRDPAPVRGGDWDTPHELGFSDLDVFRALRDHLLLGESWEQTDFFKRVAGGIERGKSKWGCTTVDEFRDRLASVERLFATVAAEGYRTQTELGTGRPHDEIRVAIRRDGQLLFLDGRHRLSIARLLGLSQVPVRVVARHEQWIKLKSDIEAYAAKRKGRIYQLIDHPDLAGFPAHHGLERIEIIRAALADYDAEGKRLVDIGTHWGYMAQQMEGLGFDVTAVEANKTCARFAEAIRQATHSRFTVWQGSIFDFPEAEQQDAALALSIFHHFIKTEELHEQLIRFLGRLDIELMIFEPHLHDPPAQMKGAFRNYAPDEFAEFVAGHAGLGTIELLGVAPDGRSLFKLTR